MATLQHIFTADGVPVNGVTVRLYPESAHATPPAKDEALPGSGLIDTTTTGTTNGYDGAYRFDDVDPGRYYVAASYNGHILWDDLTVSLTKQAVCMVLMAGFTPTGTGGDAAHLVVPHSPVDGTTSLTWNVRRIYFRVSTAGGAPQVTVEKSSGTGAFSATTVGSVTLGSGDSEGSQTSSFTTSTLSSNDKLRVNVNTLGTAEGFTVQVLLEES
jgi:hypothetical protein